MNISLFTFALPLLFHIIGLCTCDFNKFSVFLYEKLPCRESFRSETYCLEFEQDSNLTKCVPIQDISKEDLEYKTKSVIVEKSFHEDYESYRFIFHLFSDKECTSSRNQTMRVFETNCFEMEERGTNKYRFPGLRVFRECVEQTDLEVYVDFLTFHRGRFMLGPIIFIIVFFGCLGFCHCSIVIAYLYCNDRVLFFMKSMFNDVVVKIVEGDYFENETTEKIDMEKTKAPEKIDVEKTKAPQEEIEIQSSKVDIQEEEEGGETPSSSSSSVQQSEEEEEEEEREGDVDVEVTFQVLDVTEMKKKEDKSENGTTEEDVTTTKLSKKVYITSVIILIIVLVFLSPGLFLLGMGGVCGLSLFSPCWDGMACFSRPFMHYMYVRKDTKSWWMKYYQPFFSQPYGYYCQKMTNILKSMCVIILWSIKNSIELLVAVLSVAKLKEEINDPQHIEVWLWNKNLQLTVQVMIIVIIFVYSILISINVSCRFTSTFQTCVFVSAFKEYIYFRIFQLVVNLLGVAIALYAAFYQHTFDYDPELSFFNYTIRVAGLLVPIILLVAKIFKVLIWRGVGGSSLMMKYKRLRPMETMLIPDPKISLRLSLFRDPDLITQYMIIALDLLRDEKLDYEMEKNDHRRREELGMGKKEYGMKFILKDHQSYQYLFWECLEHLSEDELGFLKELVCENRVIDVGNYLFFHRNLKKKKKKGCRKIKIENEEKDNESCDDEEEDKEEEEEEEIGKHMWMANEREIFFESPLAGTTSRFCFRSPIQGSYIKSFCCFSCSKGFQRVDRTTRVDRRVMRYSMEEGQTRRKSREINDRSDGDEEKSQEEELEDVVDGNEIDFDQNEDEIIDTEESQEDMEDEN